MKGLVSVSGYVIGNQKAGLEPLPPKEELQWWYQCYVATDRDRDGYEKYRREFAKQIWQLASLRNGSSAMQSSSKVQQLSITSTT
ncbi:MAG: hypothetical protein ABI197_04225 [Granulicella sp.]